ncbi:hypothetical protein GCM10007916_11850 [Psychromonas marina]|uniref:diguanylate cyclase n=2 Tax=Psychromonas marina TaxID=88364 RepID=A0ABQ6DZ21_9GAMM|nr:hypothetical protein GCM10007916_11850 [Psychromonas marina]
MRRKDVETKLQVANNLLSKNANLDPLTGLPNRRFYDSFLKGKWQEVIESKASISLIIIDIDHFKTFNDDYGHQVGDEVLVVVGKTLAQCIRASTDLIARYGGEEFVAIVPNMSEHKTLQLAERMRQQISALEFKSKQITISLGSATVHPDQTSDLASLFKQADQALYDAKAQGRNRACHAKSDLGK